MQIYRQPSGFTDETEKKEFVNDCDRAFAEQIRAVVPALTAEKDLKILGLTGPSCSGKTTAAKLLTEQFEKSGRRVVVVSIDDFYFDRPYLQKRVENNPEIGIDYDSEETIDIPLLEEKIESLISCRRTELPSYSFTTGLRGSGEVVEPNADDVILVEGIQILYPKVDAILRSGGVYRSISIGPSTAIEIDGRTFGSNQIRLMRRLVRDYRYRGAAPEFTLFLWETVRMNEEKNIFPFLGRCDASIDSTMPYEIGMLKPFLEEILPLLPPNNPYRSFSVRLLEALRDVPTISHQYLTEKSLYKEFIR